ncbi:MAG: hypothetical protein AABZ26_06290, partial [Chloroflexota bacterium]
MPPLPLPRTITGRVFLASAITLAVTLATMAVAAPSVAQRSQTETLAGRLEGEARIVGELAREGLRRTDADELDRLARRI